MVPQTDEQSCLLTCQPDMHQFVGNLRILLLVSSKTGYCVGETWRG